MMDPRPPGLDQLLPDPDREGEIGQVIPMRMPELAAAKAKLDPTEAVRRLLTPGQASTSRRLRAEGESGVNEVSDVVITCSR